MDYNLGFRRYGIQVVIDSETLQMFPLDATSLRLAQNNPRYTIDYLWIPSVTSIMQVKKPIALAMWEARIGQEKAEEIRNYTASVGEIAHFMIEKALIDNCCPDSTMKAQMYNNLVLDPENREKISERVEHILMIKELIKQFIQMYGKRIKVVGVEEVVFCLPKTAIGRLNVEYAFAGRIDIRALFYRDGHWRKSMIDIKTSKENREEKLGIQLAAYNLGADSWCDEYYLLRLHPYNDQYNSFSFVPITPLPNDFLDCCRIFYKTIYIDRLNAFQEKIRTDPEFAKQIQTEKVSRAIKDEE